MQWLGLAALAVWSVQQPVIEELGPEDLAEIEAREGQGEDVPAPEVVPLDPETGEPLAPPPTVEQPEPEPETDGDPMQVDPAYVEQLRSAIRDVRERVMEKVTAKLLATQESRLEFMAEVLFYVSMGGLLLLFMPVFLANKYPGQLATLFKYSVLAMVTFFVAVNLFALVLTLLRSAQAEMGQYTNPKVRMVHAAFDVLEKEAHEYAPFAPILVEPTLASLSEGNTEDSVPVIMLGNIQKFREDLSVFGTIADFFKGMGWLFGYLPIALAMLTALLFLVAVKDTLLEIVYMPARAASGVAGVGRNVLRNTFSSIGRELLATLGLIVLLVIVMLFAGVLLSYALYPAMEAFLAYLMFAFVYVMTQPDAQSALVLACLSGTIVFLLLNLLSVLLGSVFFLGKSHKILRARFQFRVPMRVHGRFWKWGVLAMIWVVVLPYLYILGAQPLVEWMIEVGGENWTYQLLSGPAVLVALYALVFWAARGFKALGFLLKYPVALEGAN